MMILNLTMILVLVVGAAAALEKQDAQSQILEETYFNDGSGNYRFSFKTSNGLYRTETGQLTTNYDSSQKYIVRGSYSYIDPDGNEVVVHYIADENGYVIVKPVPTGPASISTGVLASLLG
ncbi:endocuticle structural protein SgAbd-6-like isoform X1 [Cydia pomonella]|uniref:endocuticle structural protein SgAbd-6-like isoform X1 n=1 Tax=Cydia pomonella TaxID=82600 RepID=UPI002ADD5E23|nr:endocuticle structural protein SgAbd-6-like isoform X1 [Cydia pomonella]